MTVRTSLSTFRGGWFHKAVTSYQRTYSTKNSSIAFTFDLDTNSKDLGALLAKVKQQTKIDRAGHNTAVLLTTPQYSRWLENEDFMKDFVSFMSGSRNTDQFHVLSAVVDHLAPPIPSNRPINGMSVLRGRLEDILPGMWEQSQPKVREDADKVSALVFNTGGPRLTLPLANTTFLNHKTSTLFASRYTLSQGAPALDKRIEKHLQHVNLPLSQPAKSVKDLGLWAPLVPLTQPRMVTESFGNIVRRVNINDDSVPASIELEPVVDELFKKGSSLARSPMGIWAVITPPTFSPDVGSSLQTSYPDPEAIFTDNLNIHQLAASTSNYLQELYGHGARLYQILSGGGGWGAKKGLLSLDPQRTHFALSEEEEMQQFIQAIDSGNFVPVGSTIQFFATPQAKQDESTEGTFSGFVFGTSGSVEPSSKGASTEMKILENHFGALSNEGVFATSSDSDPGLAMPGFNSEWKLNVPHSRIFLKSV